MRSLTLLFWIALFAGCSSVAHQSPFAALLAQPLTDEQRIAVSEACDDFDAVMRYQKPIHAALQQFGISDGGSWSYSGRGYRIIVWKQWVAVKGGRSISFYGPEVRFDQKLFPWIRLPVSCTAFYEMKELRDKLGESKPDEERANPPPEPTTGLSPGRGSP